jgi:hypothetical protein
MPYMIIVGSTALREPWPSSEASASLHMSINDSNILIVGTFYTIVDATDIYLIKCVEMGVIDLHLRFHMLSYNGSSSPSKSSANICLF